jgi:hypothetical protein
MALNRAVAAASYSGHNMKGLSPSSTGLGTTGDSTCSFDLNVCRLIVALVTLFLLANDDDGQICDEGFPEYDEDEILSCS